jgi:hypothetical protein
MAAKGCERLLLLPCGPREHRPAECLRATLADAVNVEGRGTRQPGSSRGGFSLHAFCILILGGSRMRRSARTVLCGGRSVTIVPTASLTYGSGTSWDSGDARIQRKERETIQFKNKSGLQLWQTCDLDHIYTSQKFADLKRMLRFWTNN